MEQDSYKNDVINSFINSEGHLKAIPSQLKKKLIIFEHMISKLNGQKIYTEKDLNEYIKNSHMDFALYEGNLL